MTHPAYRLDEAKVTALLQELDIAPPECGFSVGPGWFDVVADALRAMVAAGWDRKLDQVKTKFCGLRIYTNTYAPTETAVGAIIRKAEETCATMCEECGAPHGLVVPRSGVALCVRCKDA